MTVSRDPLRAKKEFLLVRRIGSSFKPWLEEKGEPITYAGLFSPRLRAPALEEPADEAGSE
jgi:hypothetical protein